jgi:4-amino-4-deoxy-L-arabinose transferase-like glycosyltransferase
VRGLSGGRSWHLLLTGGLIGCATLTQPSFILLPAVLGLAEVAATGSLRVPLRHGLVVVFGVALVLAPWIWRNYRIFGELVMVSTNGGDVLYRANNPLATGTYTERGEVDLQGMAELERNRRGGELAREWIRNHPRQFLHLAFRKQIAFLGDDNMGAYETLRRGLGIGGPTLHLAKLVSTGYWMLIWMLILLGWLRAPTLYQLPLFSIPLLIVICQLVIDSVYESGSRHHVPLSGLLAILAAVPFGGSLRR